jgi:hypothetical protein
MLKLEIKIMLLHNEIHQAKLKALTARCHPWKEQGGLASGVTQLSLTHRWQVEWIRLLSG